MKLNKASLICLCWFAMLSPWVLIAEPDEQMETEQPRWFEIEVIVFKPSSNQGLFSESWDPKQEFPSSKQDVDFLQPYYLAHENPCFAISGLALTDIGYTDSCEYQDLPIEQKNQINSTEIALDESQSNTNQLTQTSETLNSLTDASPKQNDHSVIDIHSLDEEANLLAQLNQLVEEKPFLLLEEAQLQLINEANSLQRHPEYKLLTHIAWRQPVLNKSDAVSVRIAGGEDFSEYYDYQGNRLNTLNSPLNLNHEQQLTPLEDGQNGQNSQIATEPSSYMAALQTTDNEPVDKSSVLPNSDLEFRADASTLTFEEPLPKAQSRYIAEIEPMLWVPEVDGYIKIYLNRFLHINTDLYLRRPDKEEIEAIDLNRYDPTQLFSFTQAESQLFSGNHSGAIKETDQLALDNESNNENLLNSEAKTNVESFSLSDAPSAFDSTLSDSEHNSFSAGSTLLNKNAHQFSWEISDDFLQADSEKMYIERLFNYSIKQSRRVRSGELHYFDHPLVGIFVIIRPYEPSQTNQSDTIIN